MHGERRAPSQSLSTGNEPGSGWHLARRVGVADIAQRQSAEPRYAEPEWRIERGHCPNHPCMRVATLRQWQQHQLEILCPAFACARFDAGDCAADLVCNNTEKLRDLRARF